MAKSNKKLPEPFTAIACHRLRQLGKIRDQLMVKKESATKSRDQLEDEINACGDEDAERCSELKASFYDEVHEISRCNAGMKATVEKIIETIAKGDQAELFEEEGPKITVQSLFAEKAKKAVVGKAKDEEGETDGADADDE